jgi:hypothetical protein
MAMSSARNVKSRFPVHKSRPAGIVLGALTRTLLAQACICRPLRMFNPGGRLEHYTTTRRCQGICERRPAGTKCDNHLIVDDYSKTAPWLVRSSRATITFSAIRRRAEIYMTKAIIGDIAGLLGISVLSSRCNSDAFFLSCCNCGLRFCASKRHG